MKIEELKNEIEQIKLELVGEGNTSTIVCSLLNELYDKEEELKLLEQNKMMAEYNRQTDLTKYEAI